ncbi:hypothetical protein SLS62_001658 [Diatrype stigma]|uniref:Mitochondrial resolvase Ydc2 catalytic domain-containing protein n=1 Tax=Diatrype stigma TaxID=117547 RepID=A0AAN9UZW5_9PEZI
MVAAAAICDVLPPSLKLAQLQRVAFLCGLTTSGTKSVIRQRLVDAATTTSVAVPIQPQPRGRRKASPSAGNGSDNRRILSIDLGLRNLAWSLLTPAPAPSPARRRAGTGAGSTYDPCVPPPVHLHAWMRNSLVKAPSVEEEEQQRKVENEFSPARMAVMAVRLVRQTLLPLNPTHVLIERQRFRTGGAAPVQEWTLRVNTLEAMIHAAFRTLVECGHWDGEVVSVSPTHVGPFWLDGGDGGKSSSSTKSKDLKGAKAKLNMKREKIDILGNWLDAGDVVLPQNENVEAMVDTFTQYWKRKPHARKLKMPKGSEGGEDEVIKKIDDLADCVLQGLAWMKWEENKANLHSTDGIMKLLDL